MPPLGRDSQRKIVAAFIVQRSLFSVHEALGGEEETRSDQPISGTTQRTLARRRQCRCKGTHCIVGRPSQAPISTEAFWSCFG